MLISYLPEKFERNFCDRTFHTRTTINWTIWSNKETTNEKLLYDEEKNTEPTNKWHIDLLTVKINTDFLFRLPVRYNNFRTTKYEAEKNI